MCCVGYGDFLTSTSLGRIVNSFAIMINLFVFLWGISVIFSYLSSVQSQNSKKGFMVKTEFDSNRNLYKYNFKNDFFLSSMMKCFPKQLISLLTTGTTPNNNTDITREAAKSTTATGVGGVGDRVPDMSPENSAGPQDVAPDLETETETVEKEDTAVGTPSNSAKDPGGAPANGAELKLTEEEKRELRWKYLKHSLITSWLLLFGIILIGTIYFTILSYDEIKSQRIFFTDINNWPSYNISDALRFCIISLTSVGYGDVYPQTINGRIFTGIFLLLGVSILTRVVGATFDAYNDRQSELKKQRGMARALLSADAMQEMDEDGSGDIDRYEFLRTMLIIRGDVKQIKIDRIMAKFNAIDTDGSGEIDFEDFRKATQKDLKKMEQKSIQQQQQQQIGRVSKGSKGSSVGSAAANSLMNNSDDDIEDKNNQTNSDDNNNITQSKNTEENKDEIVNKENQENNDDNGNIDGIGDASGDTSGAASGNTHNNNNLAPNDPEETVSVDISAVENLLLSMDATTMTNQISEDPEQYHN